MKDTHAIPIDAGPRRGMTGGGGPTVPKDFFQAGTQDLFVGRHGEGEGRW